MFLDPPTQSEFREIIRDKLGSWQQPMLIHVGSGMRKGSFNFWFTSFGILHKGTLRSSGKNGKFVVVCGNNRIAKCKYEVYLSFKGEKDTTEERAKKFNWFVEPNPEFKPHILIPDPSTSLPETYQKNVTRYCYYGERFFYHHQFRNGDLNRFKYLS